MGAAIDALGGDPRNGGHVLAIERVLSKRVDFSGSLPCGHRDTASHMRVNSAIYHLNDFHKMPRNEIADWLAGLGL